MSRRLNYLHVILNENKDSMLYKFFMEQSKSPKKCDWVSQVKNDILKLELNVTIEDIQMMKKVTFKKMVRKNVEKNGSKIPQQ